MLIDVRNLKDVERVSTLIKECYLKALCEDAVVMECVEVLTATPDLVRLSGSLPHKPSTKDIITALLRGQKLVVYFSNSRATTPEEMDIIAKYFTTYQKLIDYVEYYTIDKAIRSGANLKDILNELNIYEADDRALNNKSTQEGTPKCENIEPLKIKCQKLEGMRNHPLSKCNNLGIEKMLNDFVDSVIGAKICDELLNIKSVDSPIKTTKSRDIVTNHIQKCKDKNISTVTAKSTGDLTIFTLYRDGVSFEFPVNTKYLKTLKNDLNTMLDPQLLKGYYHTTVEYKGESKQVHIGLTGKFCSAVYLQVRNEGESKGEIFAIHRSSQLLSKFRLLLDEAIKLNENLGRC